MAFTVQAGASRIALHHAMTVLVTGPDGQINGADQQGLFFRDTRLISAWMLTAAGLAWESLSGGAVSADMAKFYLTNPAIPSGTADIPRRSVALVLNRRIDAGLRDGITVTNYGRAAARFDLSVHIVSDFADVFEAKANRQAVRGENSVAWSPDIQTLTALHRNGDFVRGLTIRIKTPAVTYADSTLSFPIALQPGEAWHATLLYDLIDGSEMLTAPDSQIDPGDDTQTWRESVLQVQASDPSLDAFCAQASDDLAALRLGFTVDGRPVTMPAAGLPWFIAPFGRDSLIVSLQAMMLYPGFAQGSLAVLGQHQAAEYDPRRDAEPGKIMHELRYGELAHFKLVPHTPYFGTADATPLYLITLHEAWKATGDHALLTRHLVHAEAALRWIDTDGDRDGDGFQEYQARSATGYENMAWKDSGDAINMIDGSPVQGPKALCELQGYVYDAWTRMAEIFDALARPDQAAALRTKAASLFERFNAIFWDEAGGFYALTLDGTKRPVFSVASNPGHLLWSGIVPANRARRVVDRLMRADMFSGWGIRTLSADHARFDPYSYHNGSVWPHDNSLIALGMKRYGFAREAAQVARAVTDAARHFQAHQIPELYAGLTREPRSFPVRYAGANVPQAWAAGSAFALLQAMLSIAPDAPNGCLYVDPSLPDWLTEVTLRGLRCGSNSYDIQFRQGVPPDILRGNPSTVRVGPRPLR